MIETGKFKLLNDTWTSTCLVSDKLGHFIGCANITLLLGFFVNQILSGIIAIIIGLCWEFKDSCLRETSGKFEPFIHNDFQGFSIKDLVADILGACVAVCYLYFK